MAYRYIALLLGFLWLPASSHCLLEAAEWLEADAACESSAPHGDANSSHDACASCQFESNTLLPVQSKALIKACQSAVAMERVSPPREHLSERAPEAASPFPDTPQARAFHALGLQLSGSPRAPGFRA